MGLNDDSLLVLESILLLDPQRGAVIEGTGGARKLRIQLGDNRGKSGGGRVIYVDIEERRILYFLYAYPKNVQENLTAEQTRMIKLLIEKIKKG